MTQVCLKVVSGDVQYMPLYVNFGSFDVRAKMDCIKRNMDEQNQNV